MILDATYNPYFSQVETDAGQVDVNLRYALYYPENPYPGSGTHAYFSMLLQPTDQPGIGHQLFRFLSGRGPSQNLRLHHLSYPHCFSIEQIPLFQSDGRIKYLSQACHCRFSGIVYLHSRHGYLPGLWLGLRESDYVLTNNFLLTKQNLFFKALYFGGCEMGN